MAAYIFSPQARILLPSKNTFNKTLVHDTTSRIKWQPIIKEQKKFIQTGMKKKGLWKRKLLSAKNHNQFQLSYKKKRVPAQKKKEHRKIMKKK